MEPDELAQLGTFIRAVTTGEVEPKPGELDTLAPEDRDVVRTFLSNPFSFLKPETSYGDCVRLYANVSLIPQLGEGVRLNVARVALREEAVDSASPSEAFEAYAATALADELKSVFGPIAAIERGKSGYELDEILANCLETRGQTSKEFATNLRSTSATRAARQEDEWRMWIITLENPPYGLVQAARALWRDVVASKIRRSPVRFPTELHKTIVTCCSSGGVLVGQDILVEPAKGMILTLDFNQVLGSIKSRGNNLVNLRQVLGGPELRTYLASLLIYQDQGMSSDGAWTINGPGDILDVIGARRRTETKRGKQYERYSSFDTRETMSHLDKFKKIRVRVVGNLEAETGDALNDILKDRCSGKTVAYAHSRLVANSLHSDYFQLPRAICRLSADDIPLAIGIARTVRHRITAYKTKNTAIEAPILEWLNSGGIDWAGRLRKTGRSYWNSAADDIIRIAALGDIGNMSRAGTEREIVLSIKPFSPLVDAYGGLFSAAKKQASVKRAALFANHKQRLKG